MGYLEVTHLSRSFGGLKAVNDVSLSVERTSITAVIGPNGAGKTTLFNCICGAIKPDSGSVIFDSRPVTGFPPHRIAAQGISRTYQNIKLFSHMTVLENVIIGCHRLGTAGMSAGMLRLPFTRAEEQTLRGKAIHALEIMNISHLADTDATGLAFGQQRAVEFARALAARPTLLLLDEPAAGLNIHETAELSRLISRIRSQGITILLIEHDMSLVMEISDTIYVLANGQRIAAGKPREIQTNPEVVRVYLGDDDAEAA